MNIKVIDPVVHSICDYVLVLVLWLSPSIFNLSGSVAILLYLTGLIHFLNTVCAVSPLGLFRIIPFKLHGWIELTLGGLLIIMPWILGYSQDLIARNFCLIIGIILVVFWYLSSYRYSVRKKERG